MRSSQLASVLVGLFGIGAMVGCAKPDPTRVCHPVTTLSAPAYSCAPVIAVVPPPVVEAPKPPEAPPSPPVRAKVNTEKLDLTETVEFDTDSDRLLDKSKTLLDEVAALITAHPELTKIQVEGYTDSTATRQHNLKLSADRATAVKAYLVDKGIDGKRLTTKGFGQDKPVGDNNTEEGRHENRRVDFRILARTPQ